jgi:hypothetical protein
MTMEDIIRANWKNYTIIRMGNITWGRNRRCMIPFFKDLHKRGGTPDIQDVYRYVTTIKEFQHYMRLMKRNPTKEFNITGKIMKVKDIWEAVKNGSL